MLAPRIYKAAVYAAFACLFLGGLLAIAAIWTDIGESEVTAKCVATLIVIFVSSVLSMALASVEPKDPLAGKHKSFRLTIPDRSDAKDEGVQSGR